MNIKTIQLKTVQEMITTEKRIKNIIYSNTPPLEILKMNWTTKTITVQINRDSPNNSQVQYINTFPEA